MSKQFLGVILIIIVVLVGIFALTGNKLSQTSSNGSSTGTLTQHVEGQGTTGVTLVEYGDYQCPYCGQYFPTVKQVVAEYGDKIKFQFRNFPLTGLHQNAFAAARAAEAAGLQNKFWEMNDVLYQTQSQWSNAGDPTTTFDQYAQQLGLNLSRYKTDYASSKVNDLINADEAEGNKLGIQGTPTFFLDGKQIQVANAASAFEKLINAEIAKKAGSSTAAPASAGQTSQTPAQ
ncbi:MAG TPA: thioredoxin domain-containing protein [Candidatus Dormibacteraeota bacterium]|nr:thioredoxin domain-containing protein [Candidatus Dormibacteraeota bacterium]